MSVEHFPVMLDQVMEYFTPFPPAGRICDGTYGGGGHTARLLELCSQCTVTAIDADGEMIRRGRERWRDTERLTLIHGWFDEVLPGLPPQDRVLLDVGVSMFHLREADRGFSLKEDGPLDMRLDVSGDGETAAELIGRIGEAELADVLYLYGEERYARRIARAIIDERLTGIETTGKLADVVKGAVPPKYRHGRNHPATRTFQALRIAVNDELRRIERAVPAAANRLAPNGRLAVITFHSLEDRIVKHAFRRLAGRVGDAEQTPFVRHPAQKGSTGGRRTPMYEEGGQFRLLTRKPVVPTEQEVASNPASRSAKLRVLECTTGETPE
ncbi:MAG: 16S rRNA (cytosine(1402)-N(4))-methyltransferase RsmH [Alkalispirochaeta sp.]